MASTSSSTEGFPSPSSSLLLLSLEDGILILPLAIRNLCDDRDAHDDDGGCASLEVHHLHLKSHPNFDTCKHLAFAPSFGGFDHIWTVVPDVALLPTCEASSLPLLFPVNVKEKILDL
jgi:hypothetical protein